MDITLVAGSGITGVVLVVALVQVAKSLGLNSSYAPIFSLVLGLVVSISYAYFNGGITYASIIIGLVIGLSGVGAWSTTSNTLQGLGIIKK